MANSMANVNFAKNEEKLNKNVNIEKFFILCLNELNGLIQQNI